MDSLSVKFLQLHQEKIVVTNYTQWDSTTNKSTILPWKMGGCQKSAINYFIIVLLCLDKK